MERVGVRELRLNASHYVDRAATGESFEVTKRGVVVAVLSPPAAAGDREQLIRTGQLLPRRGDVRAVRPRRRTGPSLSTVLSELRADER